MANRKMYAVAMTILQTMTEVFPKEHLDFLFVGLQNPADVVEMVMLNLIKRSYDKTERNAKRKSTVVNKNRAPLASERCVATDEICVKGVRGCFPDKRFIGSCFGRGL